MRLLFGKNDTHLLIGGKTFYIKTDIKKHGGTWSPKAKTWTLPLLLDTEDFRANLSLALKEGIKKEKDDAAAAAAFDASPEGKKKQMEQVLALKNSTNFEVAMNYSFICCKDCKVLDWKRKTTTCEAHKVWTGQGYSSMFVNGRLRTGD